MRRGAARPRAARRHSTRRICRPPPFFLATRRLTDTRGLPPTDKIQSRARRPVCPSTRRSCSGLRRRRLRPWGGMGRSGEEVGDLGRWGVGLKACAAGSGGSATLPSLCSAAQLASVRGRGVISGTVSCREGVDVTPQPPACIYGNAPGDTQLLVMFA